MATVREIKEIEALNDELMRLLGEQNPAALKVIGKIKRMGEQRKENSLIGYAYYRYAYFYYFSIPNRQKFRKHVQLAIKYLLRSDDKEYLGGAYNLIAYDAQDLGCYDVAYAYFMIAVQASEQQPGIALPGLIEASAGRLLIELGEYRRGIKQQQHAIKRIRAFTDMHVYHYNMILTYADIAMASFRLGEKKGVADACQKIDAHYAAAGKEEQYLSRSYYLLANIYQALLVRDDERLEEMLPALIRHWKKMQQDELFGLMYEIETLTEYMIDHDYIRQAAQLLKATAVIKKNESMLVVLRFHTLEVRYFTKVHDLEKLRACLRTQHAVQKKQSAEAARRIRYSMEFSDMMEAIAREREKVKEENIELQRQANTDALTGLPNRNAMNRVLQEKFDEALAKKTTFGIGIIDIDNFKQYNDRYGHRAGDRCLKQVGKALLSFNENTSLFCARYGGDEFVVGYFGMSSREIAKLKQMMAQRVETESAPDKKEMLHISQGSYNAVPDGKKKLWDYLSIADKKLYRIKKHK